MNEAAETKRYVIRVVRGAFLHPEKLDALGAKVFENLGRDEWISIDELKATLDQIKELQEDMVKHYDDTLVPWFLDGYEEDDQRKIIVAFGADDGEGGRIFRFDRNDAQGENDVVQYGVSKGIPKEQLNFLEVPF